MLARLFLLLLMALLSVPAMASPGHGAMAAEPAMAMAGHHDGHSTPAQPERHHADSACLGCIAPSTLPAPFVAPFRAHAVALRMADVEPGAPFGPAPPTTPPPREA